MSRLQSRYLSIGDIRRLRQIAKQRAEMTTLLAEQSCRTARRQRQDEEQRLDNIVDGWVALHSAGVFAPELAASWGGAIERQAERVEAAGLALGNEGEKLEAARTAQFRANAELMCSEALWRDAGNRYSAFREDQVIAEAADATTRFHFGLRGVRA